MKVVAKQDNMNGSNYWYTEGGLMLPKAAGLFKTTDMPATIDDTPPDYVTPAVDGTPKDTDAANKSANLSKNGYLIIEYGYPVAAGIVFGFIGYKLASKYKKPKFVLTLTAVLGGAALGSYASSFHFKKIGFKKPTDQEVKP